jgi:hypothetical protein
VDPRRLRIGEWLTGLGGVVLIGSTFLNWYDFESTETSPGGGSATTSGSTSAWQAFSVLDILLVILGVLAVTAAVMAAAHNTPAASLALASLTALVGLIVLVAIVVRTVSPPDHEVEIVVTHIPSDDMDRAAGLWIGLGAALLTTVGAFAAMRDQRFPRAARIDVPVEAIPPPEGGKA